MDYNLTGLDPRNFEHLTQALAAEVIAKGVTPFGDGPDGGREATYRGRMEYPSREQPWDGYLVIQCKFRQRPHKPADEGRWALEQLKGDLEKFTDVARNLPKPEYYLFVTNVNLTPAPLQGSKDRVFALLQSYGDSLGLKGYDVWDFDKLCRLLDGHAGVRQTYGAFITAGDILVAMMDRMPDVQPDFWHVISLFLQRELEADQYARLQQLDESYERPISLANVFVDLPASDRYSSEPPGEENDPDHLPPGLVAEILDAGSQPLRGSAFSAPTGVSSVPTSGTSQNKAPAIPEPGRFVVVGGPGQGKSTIAQFICQLYRAAILRTLPAHKVARDAHTIINMLDDECERSGTPQTGIKRFPVRVILDQFATCLAKEQCTSLLTYIASRISAPDNRCAVEDLRKWLGRYSWLLVLDGLDEVPLTSNRAQVLEQITEFWREAKALDADVLVVATTRPQGYSDDFSPDLYLHRYLTPLSPARALYYARRLVEARYGRDLDQKERVLNRLTQACGSETTARLMRSPLQVTIMAALVDRVGQAPQERWGLFQRYYDVFYNRECEKETGASRILRERRLDVNAIHRRVGLVLQTEAERAGTTESRLPLSRFVDLVRARLSEEGHEGHDLEQRTREIIDASVTRLVFLVRVGENLGFEIRSLQEFMAAEALMEGKDNTVRERLVAIAPSAHWRNVFLFAAGKCFADRTALRDTVYAICDQLNDPATDALSAASLAGSRLALDILLEGVAAQQPKFARQLARLACELMSVPDDSENRRLAAVHDSTLDIVFRDRIRDRLEQLDFANQVGAWSVLRVLLDRGVSWAVELANVSWPSEPERRQQIMMLTGGPVPHTWSLDKLAEILPRSAPQNAHELWWGVTMRGVPRDNLPKSFVDAGRLLGGEGTRRIVAKFEFVPGNAGLSASVMMCGLGPVSEPFVTEGSSFAPEWACLLASTRFTGDPSPETLARELRWLSEAGASGTTRFARLPSGLGYLVPWPMAACLEACKTSDDCAILAARVEHGELGTHQDWVAAESRWQEQVTLADWRSITDDVWPFDARIGDVGFPLGIYLRAFELPFLEWDGIWDWYERLPGRRAKSCAAAFLLDSLYSWTLRSRDRLPIAPVQLRHLATADPRKSFQFRVLRSVRIPKHLNDDWLDLFEELGRDKVLIYDPQPSIAPLKSPYPFRSLAQAYRANPKRRSLVGPLAVMAISGDPIQVPMALLDPARAESDDDRLALMYCRLSRGAWSADEARGLVEALLHSNERTEVVVELALHALLNESLRNGDIDTLALALHAALRDRPAVQSWQTFQFIKARVEQRQSPFQDSKRWSELDLPPLPREQAAA